MDKIPTYPYGIFTLPHHRTEQRIGQLFIVFTSLAILIACLGLSILIATPLAWLVMQKWLQGFAYRQNMQWWVVAWAATGALAIAFGTIIYQSVSAAIANPVKNLRTE